MVLGTYEMKSDMARYLLVYVVCILLFILMKEDK